MRTYQNQPAGTISRARALRRDATPGEKRLRGAMRHAFPDTKFRFQSPVGLYFADFLCFASRLIIEVDGGQHDDAAAYDAARTRTLEREGFRVIRFWNNEIIDNIDGVLAVIAQNLAPPAEAGKGAPAAAGWEE